MDVVSEGLPGQFDVIVACQTFNTQLPSGENLLALGSFLRLAFAGAHLAVSVDMLSKYVDFEDPNLAYYAPEAVFELARSITGRVALRHDYRAHEFAVQLFHDRFPGYVP